jgi:beta-exotoxin I transport system permease protein
MKGALVLLVHSLKRVRTLMISMSLLLGVFQVFLVIVARSIQASRAFDQMGALVPSFLRELVGPSFTAFMSFGGIIALGYFHVAVMGSLVAVSISLSTMLTSEIETGFMDLILSRPLARHWVITRSIAVALICTTCLLLAMMIGTWAGLNTLAANAEGWPSPHLIISLGINLGLLMLSWSGVGLAIGSASRRRSVAGGIAGLVALTTFLLDYVARAWEPAESVAWLSPFRYYSPFELLMGNSIPPKNVLVLAGTALVGFALAYLLFARRDISH